MKYITVKMKAIKINIMGQMYNNLLNKKIHLPFKIVWVELEGIMLSEISQAAKDKHHMISPISRT